MRNRKALAGVVIAALASTGGCPGECHCSITTEQLPSGVVGRSYSARFEAQVSCTYDVSKPSNGAASPSWSVAAGGLPVGLLLGRDGALTGVPTTPGAFQFSVLADCSSGLLKDKPTKEFAIVVSS